jgi:hypothetical protein
MTAKDGYPGLIEVDGYDEGYPDEIAGHVEAGARIDPSSDIVATPYGVDVGFDGSQLVEGHDGHDREQSSAQHVNSLIAQRTADSRNTDRRKPVEDTADDWRPGNHTLADANAFRLLIANQNRKAAVITNQGASTVYVGRAAGIKAADPSTVFLPAGASRTFTHSREIWIVGVAGGIVDYVEENYA